jgi:hypothetical protein
VKLGCRAASWRWVPAPTTTTPAPAHNQTQSQAPTPTRTATRTGTRSTNRSWWLFEQEEGSASSGEGCGSGGRASAPRQDKDGHRNLRTGLRYRRGPGCFDQPSQPHIDPPEISVRGRKPDGSSFMTSLLNGIAGTGGAITPNPYVASGAAVGGAALWDALSSGAEPVPAMIDGRRVV